MSRAVRKPSVLNMQALLLGTVNLRPPITMTCGHALFKLAARRLSKPGAHRATFHTRGPQTLRDPACRVCLSAWPAWRTKLHARDLNPDPEAFFLKCTIASCGLH